MKYRQLTIAALLSMLLMPITVPAAAILYFTSSPTSWVGGGATEIASSNDGYDFFVNRNFDNGVSFTINRFSHNIYTNWWYLDFAAPNDALLSPGDYLNATRWPFQATSAPGLTFSGNGRGDNTLTGQFSILEAAYAANGSVLSFAADFLQYDEGAINAWNRGSIRYNSSIGIPGVTVPEPATMGLVLAAFLVLCVLAAFRMKLSSSRLRA